MIEGASGREEVAAGFCMGVLLLQLGLLLGEAAIVRSKNIVSVFMRGNGNLLSAKPLTRKHEKASNHFLSLT